MSYCVDTSSLIEAWERRYPRECFPTFWQRMDGLVTTGQLVAPDEVKAELQKKSEVWTWAKPHAEALFAPVDVPMQEGVIEILQRFQAMMKRRPGRSAADPWVVALARIRDLTVVTEEGAISGEANPKVPLICETFGVRWIPLRDLIRREGWRF